MAHKRSDCGPGVYSPSVCEVEVTLETDEEEAGAESGHFGQTDPGVLDTVMCQGIPSHTDEENQVPNCSYTGGDIKKEPELEENEAVRVPPSRRRRPRIQFGLTALLVKELERVFKITQYPNAVTRKNLAKSLFLTESRVKHWFKMRRAKYRKHLESEKAEAAPGTQSTPS